MIAAGPLVPPCGMCRQALSEFGDMQVLLVGVDKGERRKTTLAELLPSPFNL